MLFEVNAAKQAILTETKKLQIFFQDRPRPLVHCLIILRLKCSKYCSVWRLQAMRSMRRDSQRIDERCVKGESRVLIHIVLPTEWLQSTHGFHDHPRSVTHDLHCCQKIDLLGVLVHGKKILPLSILI